MRAPVAYEAGMQSQLEMFGRAMAAMAALPGGAPMLYGPNGKPLAPTGSYTIRREAAKRTGSMKNWRPQEVFSNHIEAQERYEIVKRSIDLANNDPHAAGIIDTYATTVIGAGLMPHPAPDPDTLDLDPEREAELAAQMRGAYRQWAPTADAGGRLNFGQVQYLAKLSMMRYGEYFVLLPMIEDPMRPFRLACQVIHPLRVKTPTDLMNAGNIRDGIELGDYGQPVAAWIKKSGAGNSLRLPDVSKHFLRVPFKTGHRWNVLHGFVCKEPEQVRGWPFLAPAMKFFRDFNDLVSAELVSNVVTAALSYFIEVQAGVNPWDVAGGAATMTDRRLGENGATKWQRYEETYPGRIMYGAPGEKPHLLSANRPGTTFEPFTKTVKRSLAMACNLPYAVAFKDVSDTQYAGMRAVMLDAWRVFTMERTWFGQGFCQPIWTMLQEENYLVSGLDYPDFYRDMTALTACEFRGSPKGNIEPIKEAQADILLIKNNLKTREACIIERGGDPQRTVRQLEEEKNDLESRGLPPFGPEKQPTAAPAQGGSNNDQ